MQRIVDGLVATEGAFVLPDDLAEKGGAKLVHVSGGMVLLRAA